MTSSLRLGLNVKNNSEQRAACANSGKEQHVICNLPLCPSNYIKILNLPSGANKRNHF